MTKVTQCSNATFLPLCSSNVYILHDKMQTSISVQDFTPPVIYEVQKEAEGELGGVSQSYFLTTVGSVTTKVLSK